MKRKGKSLKFCGRFLAMIELEEITEEFEKVAGGVYSKSWFKRKLGSKEFLERYGLSIRKEREGRAIRVYLKVNVK